MRSLKINFIAFLHAFVCCGLLGVIPNQSLFANDYDWRSRPYQHVSINEDVIQLLEGFAAEQGFAIVISDELKLRDVQKVNASFKTTAEGFLNNISSLYSLIWFYDGQVLYFYSSDEQVSEFVDTSAERAEKARETMDKMGIWDDQYRWMMLPEENLLHIHGPPAYVNIIKHLIERFTTAKVKRDQSQQQQQRTDKLFRNLPEQVVDEHVLRVFSLKYAWAADQYFDDGNSERLVEGVVSKLRRIFHADPVLNQVNPHTRQRPTGVQQQEAIINRLENMIGNQADFNNEDLMQLLGGGAANMPSHPTQRSYVEADELTNSVIVYDKSSLMPLYAELIAKMDTATAQVQIEVSIIEISTDRLGELGFEWQVSGNRGQLRLNNLSNISTSGSQWLYQKPGDFSTIFTGDVSNLMARVQALSQRGEGQIISQPTVLTMNNNQALIDNSESFYIQLEGERQVDLREIRAGSMLKVTPRIVDTAPGRRVHLSVIIEDGVITDRNVGNIPIVKNSFINTNTYIQENSSLLIGGYFFDFTTKRETSVPLLGRIPLAGSLFTSKEEKRHKMARMFLITPTIIDHLTEEKYRYKATRRIIEDHKSFRNNDVAAPNFKIFD